MPFNAERDIYLLKLDRRVQASPYHFLLIGQHGISKCVQPAVQFSKMVPARQTLRVPHLGGISVGYRLSSPTPNPSKPTLILIIPFTTTVDYYLPEFENRELTDKLNLLAIEPLGHGATRTQSETFTYWDSAIMSLQLLEALGIEKAFALGTSQGGWISARMALLAPQKVGNSISSSS